MHFWGISAFFMQSIGITKSFPKLSIYKRLYDLTAYKGMSSEKTELYLVLS